MEQLASLGLFPDEAGFQYISEICVRPAKDMNEFCEAINSVPSVSKMLVTAITDDGDWGRLAGEIRETLSVPYKFDHSFQLLYESIIDLSWLRGGHYVIAVDISKLNPESEYIFEALNMISKGISHLNTIQKIKLTFIMFV